MKNMNIIAAAVLALGVAASASATTNLLTSSQAAALMNSDGTVAVFNDVKLTATQQVANITYALTAGSNSTTFMDTFNFSIGANQAAAFSVNGNSSILAGTPQFGGSTATVDSVQYNITNLKAVVKNTVTGAVYSPYTGTNSLSEVLALSAGSYSITLTGQTSGTETLATYNVVNPVYTTTYKKIAGKNVPIKVLTSGSLGSEIGSTSSAAGGQYAFSINAVPVVPVPEPESLALMLSGLALVGFIAHRRKVQN